MAVQIGKAGSDINIRLSQSPKTSDPRTNAELQPVYNALHILNQYLDTIRNEVEGTDEGTPSENIRFQRKFKSRVLQAVVPGNIVSPFSEDGMVKGVGRFGGSNHDGHPAITGPWSRQAFRTYEYCFYVALTAAGAGEVAEIGVGPGVLNIIGAKCGQMVWGADSRIIRSRQGITNGTAPAGERITSQSLSGNGNIYLTNPQFVEEVGSLSRRHEGQVTAGFPYLAGDYVQKSRTFLYPVGIALLDDYVLIKDFIVDPSRLTTSIP